MFVLKEIENHLDKDTEGYDVVLDAIDTMQRVAWHINDMKRKHEHAVRLQVSPRDGGAVGALTSHHFLNQILRLLKYCLSFMVFIGVLPEERSGHR